MDSHRMGSAEIITALVVVLLLMWGWSYVVAGDLITTVRARTDAALRQARADERELAGNMVRMRKGLINKRTRDVSTPLNPRQPYVFPSLAAKQDWIAEAESQHAALQDRIDRLAKGDAIEFGTLPTTLKTGDAGCLPVPRVIVVQVLDRQSMLVQPCDAQEVINGDTGKLMQRYTPRPGEVWMVKGVDTADITDDTEIDLTQPFEVSGTERYTTVRNASRTVFALHAVDVAAVKKRLAMPPAADSRTPRSP